MENLTASFSQESLGGTPLILTKHNKGFWQVTFDNAPLNLFNPEMLSGLELIVAEMQNNPDLRVIVFDSAIKDYFIAHFDIFRGAEILGKKTKSGLAPWFDVAKALFDSPVISIALIRGRTRGVGIEFAAACDMRFASREKAIFGQFEVGVSTIPGGGSMEFLPLLVGRSRALEIIIGADDFDADTAERYGLVNRTLPDAELNVFVYKLALRISRFDRSITGKAKTMINARTPAPNMADMNESRSVFIASNLRPERKPVSQKLLAWGIQQDGDFERNLGSYLAKIGDDISK
ncbi:enoyl-CoA hydratase/isomerase family protein [Mucilaginibacter sp. CAU 1740]|uniref:enoyl-CoA hydratase/isomerase family protein n=1 Tax=Mucilaginibacter sp. CAU 1740 TaxID=3140365 RepID=UPI00325A6D64